MNDFEKWTLILAAISAVVSAVSCIFAWLSARASYLQLKENKKANVVVSFQCLMHKDVVLRVQNLGGSVAQFIGLRFEENFLKLLNGHGRKKLENLDIARITLGINQSVYYSLGSIETFDNLENTLTHIEVEYRDNTNKKSRKGYKENIVLDFSGYNGSLIYTSPEDELSYLVSEIKTRLDYITTPAEGLKIQPVQLLKDK